MKMSFHALLIPLVALVMAGCGDGSSQPPSIASIADFQWRPSLLLGDTGVLRIRNKTDKPTPIVFLDYHNQDSGEERTYCVGVIEPHATVEVGVLESGWAIEPNEVVTVYAAKHLPQSLYFYKDRKGQMVMAKGYAAKKARQIGEGLHDVLK